MINWRRIRREEHDKKRCNMVCQKALLWQIHNAGILSVEGVVGMDLIDKHNAIDAVNDAIAEYIPLLEGKCIEIPLAIARAIMNMPSAKSNVIRCKDCKHYRSYAGIIDGYCNMAEWYGRFQNSNDFCSRAKLRLEGSVFRDGNEIKIPIEQKEEGDSDE